MLPLNFIRQIAVYRAVWFIQQRTESVSLRGPLGPWQSPASTCLIYQMPDEWGNAPAGDCHVASLLAMTFLWDGFLPDKLELAYPLQEKTGKFDESPIDKIGNWEYDSSVVSIC